MSNMIIMSAAASCVSETPFVQHPSAADTPFTARRRNGAAVPAGLVNPVDTKQGRPPRGVPR